MLVDVGAGGRGDVLRQGEDPAGGFRAEALLVVGGGTAEVEGPVAAAGHRRDVELRSGAGLQPDEVPQVGLRGAGRDAAVGDVAGVAQLAARVQQAAADRASAVGEHDQVGRFGAPVGELQDGPAGMVGQAGDPHSSTQGACRDPGGQRAVQQGPGGVTAGVGAKDGLFRLAVADRDLPDRLGVVGDELALRDVEAVEHVERGVFQADEPAAQRGGSRRGFVDGDVEAGPQQQQGGDGAGQAAADHGDAQPAGATGGAGGRSGVEVHQGSLLREVGTQAQPYGRARGARCARVGRATARSCELRWCETSGGRLSRRRRRSAAGAGKPGEDGVGAAEESVCHVEALVDDHC
nr:hypothetical protein [Micromonospora pallida]